MNNVNSVHRLKSKSARPVCTEYGVKIKMVEEQWLQLKINIFFGCNIKTVI